MGRCWTAVELSRIARLCVQHGVNICSDEVWGDLALEEEVPFTSFLGLLPRGGGDGGRLQAAGVEGLRERLMVLMSPAKTFNTASLDIAIAVIPNGQLYHRFAKASEAHVTTPFGYAGAIAAYGNTECEAWRHRLIAYLRANRNHAVANLSAIRGLRLVR